MTFIILSMIICVAAKRPLPTLPNVSLGEVETIVDWSSNHCSCEQSPGCTDPNDPDYTDTPPRAYVSSDGVAHLWSTDAESRQALRKALNPNDPFFHNCTVHAASQFNCFTSGYDFQTWIHSPYMLPDGDTAFAFVHMEYHGWQCAGNSSCGHSEGGDCANEAIQLWVSTNGGWDWSPAPDASPSNLVAVSPYTYEYFRDSFNSSEMGFGDPSSIVFDSKSGFFFVHISASNPEIGLNGYTGAQQRGQCLLRSSTPLIASTWRAWDGNDFNVEFLNPYLNPPLNYSAHACTPVNTSMILVNVGWSTYFNKWISSGFGSYEYPNGTVINCCGAWLYSVSSDLVNWDTPQLLRPNKQEGEFKDWEYDPAFLDETAFSLRGYRNWHESIGKDTAHLYFWQQDLGHNGRSIKRQSLTFL